MEDILNCSERKKKDGERNNSIIHSDGKSHETKEAYVTGSIKHSELETTDPINDCVSD